MKHHLILRVGTKLLIPPIVLFALYVQFHGDFGPGGGFQAGVILAAAIVLYALIYGLDTAKAVVPPAVVQQFMPIGWLLYIGVGVWSLLNGGNFLEYNVLLHDPVHGQHIGILLVEGGVGITVAATMITIFYHFTGRGRNDKSHTAGDSGENDA